MNIGIGCDLVHLVRIEKLIKRRGAATFAKRILIREEYELFLKKKNFDDMVRFLGGRFACKEAIYKSVSTWYRCPGFRSVGVIPEVDEALYRLKVISKDPGLCKLFSEMKLKIHVSLSHDGDYVMSTALAEIQ